MRIFSTTAGELTYPGKCVVVDVGASYRSLVIVTTALLEHGLQAGSAVALAASSALAAALEAGLRS